MVMLDLFPRPFKYTHAAELTVVPSIQTTQGTFYPSVIFVVANFPPAEGDKPVLLKRDNVITFFHEFGHAIHALLGATELAAFSGTRTKQDFVEMPSQMLEEWVWDPEILKMISSHYITHDPLPDDMIAKIQKIKNFASGDDTLKQLYYAQVSLEYFSPGAEKNVNDIWKKYHERFRSDLVFDPSNQGYCSFGHLMGYGSKYYGYMWSKVFALDLFSAIKSHGLLDRATGERYTNDVIGRGGSSDPAGLIKKFLGRNPSSDAFFKDLGL
jgi:thimet oligopeptidase